MDKCIVLGVDADFSPQTQHALRTASELFERSAPGPHFILLTVVSLPYDPSPTLMKSRGMGQLRPQLPTREQRAHAAEVLHAAAALLQRNSFALAPPHVELVQRFGDPADEVVKVAREHWADFIVLGSRGTSSMHHLRRVFAGSISCDIVRLAPYPVTLVTTPRFPRPRTLMSWRSRGETRRVKG